MHRFLKDQLKLFSSTLDTPPADWREFLAVINGALEKAESDRSLVEQTLQVTLKELREKNSQLQADINARKAVMEHLQRAKDAADRANQAKGTFLAVMSHELRTPLNAIIGYSEMLREEAESCGAHALLGDLGNVNTAGKHLLNVINNVLDVSKIESGKTDIFVETFSPLDVVEEVIATLAPLAEKNNDEMIVETLFDSSVKMNTDVVKFRQILFNLVSNAIKFTKDGTVKLKIDLSQETKVAARKKQSRRLMVTVSDTGIGMTAEQCKKIFEPFIQADSSTTRKFGGTGLGLTITKRFCEFLGGTLMVHSEHGKGSYFAFEIPLDLSTSSETPTAVARLPDRIEVPVLIVEHDQHIAEFIKDTIEKEGRYPTQFANSGAEALKWLHEFPFGMVFLSLLLPDMDGWKILSYLRDNEALASTSVIVISSVEAREEAITLGAWDYISRPVSENQVKTALRRHRREKNSFRRVLLVDSAQTWREMYARNLSKFGWDVTQAKDSAEALKSLENFEPDVVLMDVNMPDLDGFQLLEKIRAQAKFAELPVMIFTSKELNRVERDHIFSHGATILPRSEASGPELREAIERALKVSRANVA